MAAKPALSAPFASREFNGEVLLTELSELKAAQVSLTHLCTLNSELRKMARGDLGEWLSEVKALVATRLAGSPALAALVSTWSSRLKSTTDRSALVEHFERLAVTAAITASIRDASA